MRSIDSMAKIAVKFLSDHSPAILTGVSVTGVIMTSVLAVKGTPQALHLIEQEEERRFQDGEDAPTTFDKVKLVWLCYIPAAAVGGATIACIIGANTISTKRNAALISAYSLTETAFREYQEKVTEHIGDTKERKVRDEIAQDHLNAHPVGNRELYVTSESDVLCYDHLSGRYFTGSYEGLRKAQNDINNVVFHQMHATVNDFYELIGLKPIGMGYEFGWTTDKMLELDFSSGLDETGKPALHIDFKTVNVRDFSNYG